MENEAQFEKAKTTYKDVLHHATTETILEKIRCWICSSKNRLFCGNKEMISQRGQVDTCPW